MNIFIAADHGGFDLKNEMIEYLQSKNIRVDDMGAYELDPVDDFPDYAQKVAKAVLLNPSESIGILICRSGVGMDITANRYPGIRCVLGFNALQVQRARGDENVNMLSIPADYISVAQAKEMIDIFLASTPKADEKYSRRVMKMDQPLLS